MYPRDFFSTHDVEDNNDTCFVAMPFAAKYASIWNNYIKPAIIGSGLRPVRTDENFLSAPILMEILQGIASAELVVADLTDGNPNVFYELGIAHAIKHNSQVILLTQTIHQVPFDLRGLRCHEYIVNPKGIKPDVDMLTAVLRQILKENEARKTEAKHEIESGLNPPARQLIKEYSNTNVLELDRAVFAPRSQRDITVALPLWTGLLDLLHYRLIKFGHDESSNQEAYIWTNKARRVLNVGKK